ncbi:MAG: hypothetical protein NTV87_00890 [Ignavibacteriae bacterium]|jgi:hypothetical protein|nr:hypothetical protein [Ignavibacteriota bacterium]
MKAIKSFLAAVILSSVIFCISSCEKREEPQQNFTPPKEQTVNKDQELKQKEEFLRIKEEQLKLWEERLMKSDPNFGGTLKDTITKTPEGKDTLKAKEIVTTKEKKLNEKEKELNKRLDNPKVAINDYLEFIKRGIGDDKTFDANMTKASQVWESRSPDAFKKSYKSTKKFIVTEEPTVVSQKDGTASVKVKVKQTFTGKDGKEEEKESTVVYNLSADKNGKWKIKSNLVK